MGGMGEVLSDYTEFLFIFHFYSVFKWTPPPPPPKTPTHKVEKSMLAGFGSKSLIQTPIGTPEVSQNCWMKMYFLFNYSSVFYICYSSYQLKRVKFSSVRYKILQMLLSNTQNIVKHCVVCQTVLILLLSWQMLPSHIFTTCSTLMTAIFYHKWKNWL